MKILNIAHRGASGLAPENTKTAFLEALKYDIDGIEFDAHMTRDHKIVIIHDFTINRTSNGKGKVKKFNLSELKKFDFSYKFTKYKPQKILTIQDVFDIFKNRKVKLIIEIKPKKFDISSLLNTIKKNKLTKNVIIISFHYKILEKIYQKDKKIKLAFDTHFPSSKHFSNLKKINCNIIGTSIYLLRKKFVDNCHKNSFLVFPFNINEVRAIKKTIKFNVDGIMTNYPNTVQKVFKELRMR